MAARSAAILAVMAALAAAEVPANCGPGVPETGICKELRQEASAPGRVGMELLQLERRQRKAEEQKLLHQESKQFPSIGSIVNAAVDTITDQVDNITNAVTDQVRDRVADITGQVKAVSSSITNQAATIVATALNETILAVGRQADVLVASCNSASAMISARMSATKANLTERLAVLEEATQQAVGQILPLWNNVSVALTASAGVASVTLATVGQEALADKLNSSLTVALEEADGLSECLQNVSTLFENISNAAEDQINSRLAEAQTLLDLGLAQADAFVTKMNQAFDELTDQAAKRIAATVPGSNLTAIDEAFDSVDATVASVADKIVSGPSAIISGLTEATGLTADTLGQAKRSSAQRVLAAPFLAALAALGALLAVLG